jgi:hypothetical protein
MHDLHFVDENQTPNGDVFFDLLSGPTQGNIGGDVRLIDHSRSPLSLGSVGFANHLEFVYSVNNAAIGINEHSRDFGEDAANLFEVDFGIAIEHHLGDVVDVFVVLDQGFNVAINGRQWQKEGRLGGSTRRLKERGKL